ncbi:MAG TPA: CHAD domain-containing protein, partial [Aggregatilineaceae bacterium]|nr:CHAD domain-containing protein [Aggregatilineaceae bacterium]
NTPLISGRMKTGTPLIGQADIPTLHQLRIAFKRLRYALEFFEEVLGPEARMVIKETKIAQDHLGDLQDAQVVSGVMRDLLDQHNERYSGVPVFMRPDMSGVLAYASAKEDEKRALYETVPPLWDAFVRDEVRQGVGLAIAAL